MRARTCTRHLTRAKRPVVDWPNLDWSKANWHLGAIHGVSKELVRRKRKELGKPEPASAAAARPKRPNGWSGRLK
jgi:hypothetical protein